MTRRWKIGIGRSLRSGFGHVVHKIVAAFLEFLARDVFDRAATNQAFPNASVNAVEMSASDRSAGSSIEDAPASSAMQRLAWSSSLCTRRSSLAAALSYCRPPIMTIESLTLTSTCSPPRASRAEHLLCPEGVAHELDQGVRVRDHHIGTASQCGNPPGSG